MGRRVTLAPKPVKSTSKIVAQSFDKNVSLKQFDRCNTEEETRGEPEKPEAAGFLEAESLPANLILDSFPSYFGVRVKFLILVRR